MHPAFCSVKKKFEFHFSLRKCFAANNNNGNNLWFDKYRLRTSMLPSWFPKELAMQALSIGKSINFIRRTCNDAEWLLDVSDVHNNHPSTEHTSTNTTMLSSVDSFEYGRNDLLLKSTYKIVKSERCSAKCSL